jgi:hypothetical protein
MNKARTFTFQIDPDIREALELEAAEKERSIAWVISHRLRASLEVDLRLPLKSNAKLPKTSCDQVLDK